MPFLRNPISRRSFLVLGMGAMACSLLPFGLWAKRYGVSPRGPDPDNYYLKHQKTLLQAFDATNAGAQEYLAHRYGADLSRKITTQAAHHFRVLLPELPEVGGARNLDIEHLPIAAWYVAYYRPMRELGKTARDVGRMMYDLNASQLAHYPRDRALAQGAQLFTPGYYDKLRRFALWTQRRQYPGNWVATFVPGDGQNFNFGYDYRECALVKYFRAHRVSELAPYVCLNDFLKSRTLGTGLRRNHTLAQGDALCDFRYKEGRQVIQGWDTEVPKFQIS